jgi:enamine deaminase RidA (YjgF/YER057c/UK114 family)
MTNRQNVSSGTKWELTVGYSRAVRVGNHVFVAGTTATDDNGQVVGSDVYTQSAFILQKIERALREAGASMADVVRTRSFITDISDWEAFGRAHGEFFGDIRPASTLVEVSALVQPEHLIEIEVDAVIGGSS